MVLNPSRLVLNMVGQENAFKMELGRCLRIRSRLSTCSRCQLSCPEGALAITKDGFSVNEKCTLCGMCMAACPTGAIAVAQKISLGKGFSLPDSAQKLLACQKRIDEAPLMARGEMQCECLGFLYPVWIGALAVLSEKPVTLWVGYCQECENGKGKPWAFEGESLHMGRLTFTRGPMPENEAFERQNQISRRAFFNFLAGSAQKGAARSVSGLLPKAKTSDPEAVLSLKRALGRSEETLVLKNWPQLWESLFPSPHIEADRCSACMVCSRLCPTKALDVRTLDDHQAFFFDPLKCLGCGLCQDVCFEKALSLKACGSELQEREILSITKRRCASCNREWLFAGHRTLCPACVKKAKLGL